MPTQTLGYSDWSMSLISTPPPTTMRAVAVTITLAAIRIDGGSRRNFDIRRSIGFARGATRVGRCCSSLFDSTPCTRSTLGPVTPADQSCTHESSTRGVWGLVDVQLLEQCERVVDRLEEVLVVLDHFAPHVDAQPLLVDEQLVPIEHLSEGEVPLLNEPR